MLSCAQWTVYTMTGLLGKTAYHLATERKAAIEPSRSRLPMVELNVVMFQIPRNAILIHALQIACNLSGLIGQSVHPFVLVSRPGHVPSSRLPSTVGNLVA